MQEGQIAHIAVYASPSARPYAEQNVRWNWALVGMLIALVMGPAEVQVHGQVGGVAADLTFGETTGTIAADESKNGHDATVNGNFAWASGRLHLIVSGESFGWASIPRGSLMSGDWTLDLWFEATNAGEKAAGRLVSASTAVGGTGPEWFFRSGLKVAMRINNDGAVWDEPAVGSRSSTGPPDHYALPTKAIQASMNYHMVVTHDAASQRVVVHQGKASDADLEIVLDATYSGTYDILVTDIRLGHSHRDSEPRWVDVSYDRLLIYDRLLTPSEVEQNHDAGPGGSVAPPVLKPPLAPTNLRVTTGQF